MRFRPFLPFLVPTFLLVASCSANPEGMTAEGALGAADAGATDLPTAGDTADATDETRSAPEVDEDEAALEHTCGGEGGDEAFADSDEVEAVPEVENAREPRAGDLLVWVRSRSGETTLRLDRESGAVVGSASGIVIASGHETFTLRTEEKRYELPTCSAILRDLGETDPSSHDDGQDGDDELSGGLATRVVAEADGRTAEIVGFDTANAKDGVAENKQRAVVVGSIGPYVFVHQTSDVYACGAHGGQVAGAVVFDLAHGKRVDWDAELGDEHALLAGRGGDAPAENVDDLDRFDDETAARTELVPSFDESATFHLGRQFTSPTCYACSDGAWSSYTHSILVDGKVLPRALRAHAQPAAGLVAFRRAHPTLAIGGVSALGD